jgi:release factor glutamine methyltransferase
MADAAVTWEGLAIATHPDVYVPSDDTFLLARNAGHGPGRTVVEVGCGTGVASMAAARSGSRVVAADVNPFAVRLARENASRNGLRVETVRMDLLAAVRADTIDRLMLNPPYLPTAPGERVRGPLNLAFDAGPEGRSFVERLAGQLERLRNGWRPGFEGQLVVSTVQDVAWVRQRLDQAGYRTGVLDQVPMELERLILLGFAPRGGPRSP